MGDGGQWVLSERGRNGRGEGRRENEGSVVIAFIEEVAEVHTGAEMALAGTCNNINITSHSHVLFSESCLVLFYWESRHLMHAIGEERKGELRGQSYEW